uniref:Uncharacterized protein n=1 Tax=Marseillevirus LCMAC202 TaxID=2506606 RepID=A0A481YY23_9VIRU|nr:MAG: hypothetical protein LCMAC202_05140 [Marseillevirus LCMAC202]
MTFGEHFGKIGFSPIKNGTVELDKRIWLYLDELIFIQFPPNPYYVAYPLSSLPYTITEKDDVGIYMNTFIPKFGNFSLSLVFIPLENPDHDAEIHYSKDALEIKAFVNVSNIYPLLIYQMSRNPCSGSFCTIIDDLATIQHANYTLGIDSHYTWSWEAIDAAGYLRMFSGLFYYREIIWNPPTPENPPSNEEESTESVLWVLLLLAGIIGGIVGLIILPLLKLVKRRQSGYIQVDV